jgi:serine/threonine-protein kinase PknK
MAARSGEPIDESLAQRLMSQGAHALDGIGDDVAEFMEDAQVQLLLDGEPSALTEACERARARLDRVDQSKRPRANLHASIQLALCLAVTGDAGDAQRVLAPVLRTCAALGLSQLLVDEGPLMLRLAKDVAGAEDFSALDPTTPANVRDFVSNLVELSSVRSVG